MTKLEDIRKRIEEEQKAAQQHLAERHTYETIDMDAVEKIVNKMKKKYAEEGLALDEEATVGGQLGELHSIIAEGERAKINIQRVEDLQEFENPLIKALGKFYLALRAPLNVVSALIKKLPLAGSLGYYLYSANMPYSVQQFLALAVAAGFLVFVITIIVSFVAMTSFELFDIAMRGLIALVVAFYAMLFTTIVVLLIPKSKARNRANLISVELPFALRHMATELRAGIGLYKTLQTIAVSGYGVLSEEFARVINEVEEGTDTKDALRHLALRTESKALRAAILNMIRAMKTGGNLSDAMTQVAEDVSFEMRMQIRDFAEKINFFGVVFIFGAIVVPVFVAVIAGVTNAPIGIKLTAIPPQFVLLFYALIMPLVLLLLLYYLKSAQPRV